MERKIVIILITVLLKSAESSIKNDKTLLHWGQNHSHIVLGGPQVQGRCEEQGICDRVQNYPFVLVKSLLEELKTKNITKFTIENSKKENNDFENICSTKERIYFPRAAKNQAGNWQFILNGYFQPFQGFLVEMCRKGCLFRSLPFSSDYALKCVQRHVYRKMVYLDVQRKRLAIDNFEVPTCCSCSLERSRPIYWSNY